MAEGICEETDGVGAHLFPRRYAQNVCIFPIFFSSNTIRTPSASTEVRVPVWIVMRISLVRRSRDAAKYSLALAFCSCGGEGKKMEGKGNFVSGVVGGGGEGRGTGLRLRTCRW